MRFRRVGAESHAQMGYFTRIGAPDASRRPRAAQASHRRGFDKLWGAIRKKQLEGRKFRRQVAIGALVLDFYCASERLVIEVDGPNHDEQQEADRIRQQLLESLGIRFVRLSNHQVEHRLEDALDEIRAEFNPHPPGPFHKSGNRGAYDSRARVNATKAPPSLWDTPRHVNWPAVDPSSSAIRLSWDGSKNAPNWVTTILTDSSGHTTT